MALATIVSSWWRHPVVSEILIVLSIIIGALAIGVLGIYAQDTANERRRQQRLDEWWDGRGE